LEQITGKHIGVAAKLSLSRNAVIVCEKSRKQLIGLSCAEANLVTPERLQAVRQECHELIAIFVTILKRSKQTAS
jgi:hypothetical protein